MAVHGVEQLRKGNPQKKRQGPGKGTAPPEGHNPPTPKEDGVKWMKGSPMLAAV